jgi:hypothetical protein
VSGRRSTTRPAELGDVDVVLVVADLDAPAAAGVPVGHRCTPVVGSACTVTLPPFAVRRRADA